MKMFSFLLVKIPVYLNRLVFVMHMGSGVQESKQKITKVDMPEISVQQRITKTRLFKYRENFTSKN